MDTGWHTEPPKVGEEWKMAHVHVRVDGFDEQGHIMMTYLDAERKESTLNEPTVYASNFFSEAWRLVKPVPEDIQPETIEI